MSPCRHANIMIVPSSAVIKYIYKDNHKQCRHHAGITNSFHGHENGFLYYPGVTIKVFMTQYHWNIFKYQIYWPKNMWTHICKLSSLQMSNSKVLHHISWSASSPKLIRMYIHNRYYKFDHTFEHRSHISVSTCSND